jgi:hypothetical protein
VLEVTDLAGGIFFSDTFPVADVCGSMVTTGVRELVAREIRWGSVPLATLSVAVGPGATAGELEAESTSEGCTSVAGSAVEIGSGFNAGAAATSAPERICRNTW